MRIGDAFMKKALEKRENLRKPQLPSSRSSSSLGEPMASPVPSPNDRLNLLQKSLQDIIEVTEQCMQSVFPLLAVDPVRAASQLVALLNQKVAENNELAGILEDLGFCHGSFGGQPDWSLLGKNLSECRKALEASVQETKTLGTKRRAGRPFGSRNKAQEDAQGVDKDGGNFVTPQKSKRKSSEEDTSGTKKRRSEKKKTPEEVESAYPQDPEHELQEEEAEPNRRGGMILSLYTKCQIVECAKKLCEERKTQGVEKEVMARFKQYFFSVKQNRWKTGLLSKWTKILAAFL